MALQWSPVETFSTQQIRNYLQKSVSCWGGKASVILIFSPSNNDVARPELIMNERSISFCSDEIFRGVFWPFYSFLKILCKILAFKWAINKINTYFLAFAHYLFLSNLISVIANPQQQSPTHTDTDDQTLLYLSTPQPQAPHFLERLKGANANYFFRKFPFASFIFFINL